MHAPVLDTTIERECNLSFASSLQIGMVTLTMRDMAKVSAFCQSALGLQSSRSGRRKRPLRREDQRPDRVAAGHECTPAFHPSAVVRARRCGITVTVHLIYFGESGTAITTQIKI